MEAADSIVKGCWGNGLEAWRKLMNRFDPETEMSQTGSALEALRPTEVADKV